MINKIFKNKKNIILTIIGLLILFLIFIILFYTLSLTPVNRKSNKDVLFLVNDGDATSTVINNLKEEKLIKNKFTAKVYVRLHHYSAQKGTYKLSQKMSAKSIFKAINDGKTEKEDITVTFVEGKRLTNYAETISKNFGFDYDEVMNTFDDKTYINELINKYSFLTTDILNESIYHPLEGYLFPDTYTFYKTSTIKDIIEKMLDNTEIKLNSLDSEIKSSSFSIHEIMTLASIVELEGAGTNERAGIAGVFINRLNSGIALGSDVTTYYAVNKDFTSDLRVSELNSCNGYNTRNMSCVKGLPVGPIASPGLDALKAAITPEKNDYLYFVADKNGKVYFSKTDAEHNNTVARLKQEGLWYTYN